MNIFKIVLPNNDVKSAALQDTVVDSIYPNPKIDTAATPPHTGIININWASNGVVIPSATSKVLYSFPHGYNYAPLVIGAYRFDNGTRILQGVMPFFFGNIGLVLLDSDAKNVNVKYFSTDDTAVIPNFIIQIRFYVTAERGYITND